MESTAIVGVGNILMADDGVGVHVARALREMPLPDGVRVLDAGTDPDAAYDVADATRVIVIDAARGEGAPGTIYRLPEDVAMSGIDAERTCHEIGLLQTLRDVRRSDNRSQTLVIGIEPKRIAWGLELSPEVAASLPRVMGIILDELGMDQEA